MLNWYVLAPALQRVSRRDGAVTVTEVLAGPPGSEWRRPINTVCSIIVLVSLGTYVASQFQGAGKTFAETFDLSLSSSILIGSAIVVFYTLLGGFWAVSVTDTLQGLLMALTSIVLPIGVVSAVGGIPGFVEGIQAVPDESFLSLTRNLPPVVAVGFILGLLGIGLGYPGQPHVANRFMALREGARSVKQARRIAIAWAVVVYSGMIMVGLAGRILVPGLPDSEVAFVVLINQLFHPVVSGVMLAAVLSAIMSTADSQLLVASSSVTHDLGIGEGSKLSTLSRSRIVVLLISLGAVVAALMGTQRIFSMVLFAWAAMGSAFGPLLLISVLKGRVPGRFALASILVGFTSSVGSYYLIASSELWKGSAERFLSFLLAMLVAWLGWVAFKRKES